MKFRLFVLIFANIVGLVVIAYFLEIFGISNVYSKIKNSSGLGGTQASYAENNSDVRSGDLEILEEAEKNKLIESFRIKEIELSRKETSLSNLAVELEKKQGNLEIEKNNIEKQKKRIEKERLEKITYQKKVENLAKIYYNMPTKNAMERILELKDDLLILDVLKEMDAYAIKKEQQSVVPFIYSLMPKEDASRLLKKSTVSVN